MLRLATIEDVDFLYLMYMHPSINEFLLYEQMSLESFVKTIELLIQKEEIFILDYNNEKVGMCKLVQQEHRNSHCIYVGGLAVHPAQLGKGYCNLLLQKIIQFAKQKNKKRIELTVSVHNEKAIGLYAKNGFVQEGILKYYTFLKNKNEYVDEVIMAYYF
jgi:putative acetyltransferase